MEPQQVLAWVVLLTVAGWLLFGGRGGGGASDSGSAGKAHRRPVSVRGQALAAQLDVPLHPRRVVTVCIDALCDGPPDARVLHGDAVRFLQQVAEFADLHLLVKVANHNEKRLMQQSLEQSGVVEDPLPSCTPSGTPVLAKDASGAAAKAPPRVLPHRVLYFSTGVGKVAIVRQMKPALHLDHAADTLDSLAPHIRRVTRLGLTAATEGRWTTTLVKDLLAGAR